MSASNLLPMISSNPAQFAQASLAKAFAPRVAQGQQSVLSFEAMLSTNMLDRIGPLASREDLLPPDAESTLEDLQKDPLALLPPHEGGDRINGSEPAVGCCDRRPLCRASSHTKLENYMERWIAD